MTCDDLQDDLSASLDGELDAARERAVSAHLAVCERCRATRAVWAGQSTHLRDVGRLTPAPPSWERLASRLDGVAEHARHGRAIEDGADRALENGSGRDLENGAGRTLEDGAGRALKNGARRAELTARPSWIATPPSRGSARRVGLGFAACAAAAVVCAGIAGVFLLRPAGTAGGRAHAVPDALMPGLVRQLVDAGIRPDLSALGDVTPVSWDRFASLPTDARFSPLAPAGLPGGYVFDEAWVIDSKICRMVCARYRKDGRIVAILQAESNGAPICTLANPQCCRIAGMMCRRFRIDRVDLVQATRGKLALTVAAKAGETDIDSVMATLSAGAALRKD